MHNKNCIKLKEIMVAIRREYNFFIMSCEFGSWLPFPLITPSFFERQREGKGKPLIYYMVLTLLLHPACIATDKLINANLIFRSGLVHYFQHLLKRLPGSFHYLPLCLRALLTSAMPSGKSEQLICVTLCVSTNHLNVTHSLCTLCV